MKISSVAFSACLAIAHTADADGTKSREEFCQDMKAIENHWTTSFVEMIRLMGDAESTFETGFECSCSTATAVLESNFQINCSLKYGDPVEFVWEEKVTLKFDEASGAYHLSETSWSDSSWSRGSLPPPVFSFDESGALTSCEANSCSSCEICDDKTCVTVDCSNKGGFDHTYESSALAIGTFADTFDFGVIREREESETAPVPTKAPTDEPMKNATPAPTKAQKTPVTDSAAQHCSLAKAITGVILTMSTFHAFV